MASSVGPITYLYVLPLDFAEHESVTVPFGRKFCSLGKDTGTHLAAAVTFVVVVVGCRSREVTFERNPS